MNINSPTARLYWTYSQGPTPTTAPTPTPIPPTPTNTPVPPTPTPTPVVNDPVLSCGAYNAQNNTIPVIASWTPTNETRLMQVYTQPGQQGNWYWNDWKAHPGQVDDIPNNQQVFVRLGNGSRWSNEVPIACSAATPAPTVTCGAYNSNNNTFTVQSAWNPSGQRWVQMRRVSDQYSYADGLYSPGPANITNILNGDNVESRVSFDHSNWSSWVSRTCYQPPALAVTLSCGAYNTGTNRHTVSWRYAACRGTACRAPTGCISPCECPKTIMDKDLTDVQPVKTVIFVETLEGRSPGGAALRPRPI